MTGFDKTVNLNVWVDLPRVGVWLIDEDEKTVSTEEIKTQHNHCQLELADVAWSAEGLPRSMRYGDIYFSHTAGLLG
ncbi:MAG: hypothetical protein ACP5Q0_07505, partial [Halothiobacillus sp.]